MIEALAAAPCVGRAWTSCAARTAFIGRERAAKVRCRLHHLVRARQSLLHRGSQARRASATAAARRLNRCPCCRAKAVNVPTAKTSLSACPVVHCTQ